MSTTLSPISFSSGFDTYNKGQSVDFTYDVSGLNPTSISGRISFLADNRNYYVGAPTDTVTIEISGIGFGSSQTLTSGTIQPASEQRVELSFNLTSNTPYTLNQITIRFQYKNPSTDTYVKFDTQPTITVDSSTSGSDPSNPSTPSSSTRITIVTPSGGSIEYGSQVNFGFDVQANSEILDEWRAQYSTDNGYSWQTLPTRNVARNQTNNGSYEVRFSSPTIFPVGTVRWRVQAIFYGESYDNNWTSASFNVTSTSTDPGTGTPSNPTSYNTRVTIVGPYGGSREYGSQVNFAFDVQTNGTLSEWRAQYSTDDGYSWQTLSTQNVTINSSNGPYEVRFSSPTIFPVGTVRWRVQAIANGETYGDSWTSASFNVTSTSTDPGGETTPSNPSTTSYNTRISIITPYGGTFDYGSTIKFGFDVQTNGTLAEWRAQYSTDDGYSWKTLPTKNVTTSSSNGPIEVRFSSSTIFPVGTVRWRVQAIANGESYGTTWTSASFTVAENSSSGGSVTPIELVYDDTTGTWVVPGTSDSSSVYTVSCSIIQPSNGSKRSGSADISFKFSVRSSGTPTEYQAEYSTDEGLTWNALAQDSIASGQNEIIFTVPRMTLPSGPIEWRVRARANGDWQYDWTSTSFTVTYDGYGSIQATSGPINSGVLGASPIRYDATMQLIGETIGQPTLVDARFCWRSGDSSDYIARNMTIANNSAYIVIPVGTFPYGLIQWYMYGKDSSEIESETPVYATYILKSSIDSFPIKPVSTFEQSENAIEFEWGYISLNGQKLKKADIQFSEDGVTWGASVSYDIVEDIEDIEELPLIPPSGEDVFEEVGE